MARKIFFSGLRTSLVLVFLATLAIMTFFEVSKQILIPNITVWGSHIITILFTSCLAIIISYFTFQSIHEAHKRASKELEMRIATEKELQTAIGQLTEQDKKLQFQYDELEKSQHALSESEKRYHHVVEDQTEFICRFLPDGTHIFVNDAYCRYFNKKREEIIGHRFMPVLHPEDREMVTRHFALLTPLKPVINTDQRIIMPDGSTRWQRWSDRAIFDENFRVIEYQSVGRDTTDTKQTEEALRRANRKLTILSGITRHDITNQILTLNAYLEISKKYITDTSKISEFISKEEKVAKTIERQIGFTKEYEQVGVNAPLWHDCHTLVGTAAKQAPLGQIMVKNDLPEGAEVFADPLIVKVFYNLMENAVRHGGKITAIRFFVAEQHDGAHILVCEDDGDGIPEEEKKQIFERGFGKNTGLGLFLAREILDITGIPIRETGEPGRGARFEMVVKNSSYRVQ